MKIKKEYIILILIIAGLSAYLLMRSSDRTHYQLPQIAGLEQKQVTKIEISKEGNSIVLNKKDNKWYLDPPGYLVDAYKVNDMLTVFETLALTALVSESEDYVRYDLHAGGKITVKAWQEDSLMRNFDIGKAASSFRHTFVKLMTAASFMPETISEASLTLPKTIYAIKAYCLLRSPTFRKFKLPRIKPP
jgi:hypothetical protein